MFPIKYPAVWEMYKKAEASFWTGACARLVASRRARGDGWADGKTRAESV
jgi:hypothetical protein